MPSCTHLYRSLPTRPHCRQARVSVGECSYRHRSGQAWPARRTTALAGRRSSSPRRVGRRPSTSPTRSPRVGCPTPTCSYNSRPSHPFDHHSAPSGLFGGTRPTVLLECYTSASSSAAAHDVHQRSSPLPHPPTHRDNQTYHSPSLAQGLRGAPALSASHALSSITISLLHLSSLIQYRASKMEDGRLLCDSTT